MFCLFCEVAAAEQQANDQPRLAPIVWHRRLITIAGNRAPHKGLLKATVTHETRSCIFEFPRPLARLFTPCGKWRLASETKV